MVCMVKKILLELGVGFSKARSATTVALRGMLVCESPEQLRKIVGSVYSLLYRNAISLDCVRL